MTKDFTFRLDDSCDYVIDEKPGNAFIALRKVAWGDAAEAKLELRKWFVKSDGDETPGKGVTFMTEEGPHELVRTLADIGYGHTTDILRILRDRDDYKEALRAIDHPETPSSDKTMYYDPKECIGV